MSDARATAHNVLWLDKLLLSLKPEDCAAAAAEQAAAAAELAIARAAKTDQASRFMERKALTETADVLYFKKIVRQRGIAALVADVKSEKPLEEDADVWTQAMVFVTTVLDAANEVTLENCLKTHLVPEVADALGTFRHCHKLVCKAFELLNIVTELVKHVRDSDNRNDPLQPPSTARMRVWIQLATATGLCFSILCASSPQLSDSALCEAGFRFLANMLLNDLALMHHFVVEYGVQLVDLCLAALRTHRMVTFIVLDAALTLQTAVDDSDDLALFALQHNAVKLLIEATPLPLNFTNNAASHRTQAIRQLEFSAETVAAIYKAAFRDSAGHALAVRLQDAAVSDGMIELLVSALRAGMDNRDRVLQILQVCCAQKPAYAMRAIKAGALELKDVAGSTDVGTFVNRLKMLLNDAEASADAAAAELLAGEDAASARAAKAKAKRKKKPAASLEAMPPAAEINDAAASAGEQPPADRASAFELSQSESALRRRRRAATKAARRTAAVERALGGGAQPAASSSDADDDQPSAAGAAPPLPSFAADLKAPLLGGSATGPKPDALPAQVADRGSLADLFPWLAAPVSNAARAAPPAMPAPTAPAPANAAAAVPLPEHAASKPARAVTPLLRPASPAAIFDAAPAAQRHVPLPPTPSSVPAPAQPLPPLPASQTGLLERFTAQSAELARVKNELARIQDELDASKCVICLCAPRCVAMLPCRHLPLCASPECAAMMGSPPLCPLCRVRVADTLQLFV
jgi:hypothetical protein